jgi:uncharacterized membrane protein
MRVPLFDRRSERRELEHRACHRQTGPHYATGVFELLAAVAILITPLSRDVGLAICAFLLLILPSNIYAAFQRVDFGGHAAGPMYLLVRIPLQLFLIGWVYWFALR